MDRSSVRTWTVFVTMCAVVGLVVFSLSSAFAGHMQDWTHDHKDGVPPRPSGLRELNDIFGPRCSDRANNARTWFPHADPRDGSGAYVEYHSYLARNIGSNVRKHVNSTHNDGAFYPGIGSYNCRLIDGTTSWSTHAWGAAVDTNWQRNFRGQNHWNGRGADGEHYGTYLPDVYRGAFPGHRFYWGLNWSNPDPMHFQFVTNY